MTIFIEGIAFPLGEKNANGWGVPESEAENAISSLKSAVVRICSRVDGHMCDLSEDPFAEIGRITEAWKQGNEIWARAMITDSLAERKISEGTWEKNWSVFALAEGDDNEWVKNLKVLSLTLVRDPAWSQATWNIVASKGKPELRITSQFKIISASEGDTLTDKKPDETIEQLQAQLKEKESKIAELEKSASAIDELKNTKAELEKKNEELALLIAEYEKNKASSVPMEKVQEIAEGVAAAKLEAYKEEQKRTAAFASLETVRKNLGLETNPDDFKQLTAADLEKQVADLSKIKIAANSPIEYPTGNSSGTVGRWDSVKKEWVV